ncbi:MAG TPA: hypothetical protein DEP53_05850 [Bacteroidetes bacterium]|nr:hypothetical protein [Bacteroidota bacterium]
MNRSVLFWVLAAVITIASAVYQRMTGPTYPVAGSAELNEHAISYKLNRSHPGPTNAPVEIKTDDQSISGMLYWKRFNTGDPWTEVPMAFSEGMLKGELPNQPPAGKLMYRVELQKGEKQMSVPAGDPIVIRFRGDVPIFVLIPHVLAMFIAMLFSIRAGLEYFSKEPKLKKLIYWTLGVLFVGGFILGPLMQWYSFNAWWTGWPFGTDLTDNKTAVAFLAWVIAAVALTRAKHPERWALGACMITFVVYMIPHSVLGSELDYSKLDKQTRQVGSPR